MINIKLSSLEKIIILFIILISAFFIVGINKTEYRGPAYLSEPEQFNLNEKEFVLLDTSNGKVTLELMAEYKIQAGVRGRKNYKSDLSAHVAPMDLILAWADLNQPSMLEAVKYSQSGRWYYYQVKSGSSVSVSHIGNNSANTHIIPANKDILDILKKVKTNSYVELEGYLVNIVLDNTTLNTSLTRKDSGGGACEIFYVTKAKIQ